MKSISPPLASSPAWRPLAGAGQALRLGALGALAGWPVLLGRAVFYVVALVILSALWTKVAGERLPGTLAHVLPPGGFALYIGATEWITLSTPSIHLRLEDDIRSGALEARLLRPKSHLVLRFAESLGDMLARLATLGVAALVLLAASGRSAPIEGLLLLAVAALPAAVIGLLLLTLVGLAAFWVRRTLPAYLIIQKLTFLMGGLFAPISLYPSLFRRLCEASPFAANLYWPAAQLLAPSPAMLARTLATQAAWIVVLSLIVALVWDAGVQRTLRRGI